MTVVSSKEFVSNQKKYFDLAVNEDVCIKRGKNVYYLTYQSVNETNIDEDMIFEPDEDFYRSISMDEFLEGALKVIDKIYTNK